MTQANIAMFGRNSSTLLTQLEESLREILVARQNRASRTQALHRERASSIQSHVDELLPDLQLDTIDILSETVPEFMTRVVRDKIASHRFLEIPFWTWVFGGGDQYRKDAELKLIDLLKVNLRSTLDQLDPPPTFLSDVEQINGLILNNERNEAQDSETAAELRKQIDALRLARSSDKPVPKSLATAVAVSAANARKPRSHVDDDSSFLLSLLIAQDVFDNTFSVAPSGGISYLPEFNPGGGGFGGAGGTGSWDPPVTGADTVSTDSPTPSIASDEAVAGLGSIS